MCHCLKFSNFDLYGIFFAVEEESKEENMDTSGPQKVKAIGVLEKMNIKQLREEAATRGISASGTKRELLDRLCPHEDKVSRDNNLGNQIILFLFGKIIFTPMPLSILGRLIHF